MMRNGQNKRMRGRNRNNNNGGHHHHNRGHQNPLTRVYESNGPDVKIRGTAQHIAEKYLQLARDAASSGDHVTAEAHHQHAEHYLRLIAAAQEQLRQQNPHYQPQAVPVDNTADIVGDEIDEMGQPIPAAQNLNGQPNYQPQQQQPQPYGGPQPYPAGQPEPQPQYGRPQHQQPQPQPQYQPQPQQQPASDVGGLPSFITGAPQAPQYGLNTNGHDGQGGERDRFHRRRRRHRGPQHQGQEMRGEAPTEPAGE